MTRHGLIDFGMEFLRKRLRTPWMFLDRIFDKGIQRQGDILVDSCDLGDFGKDGEVQFGTFGGSNLGSHLPSSLH